MDYFVRIGVQISCLINVVSGGECHQPFSARNWELKRKKKKNMVAIIDILFYTDHLHCMKSWINWKKREIENGEKQSRPQ